MKTMLTTFLILLASYCNSQNIAKRVKDENLKNFAASIKSFKNYQFEKKSVNLIVCSNDSGSGEKEGTDEVTDRIYISVCEYGEASECKLYNVENVGNVSVEKVSESNDSISIIINYGDYGKKKSDTIVISYKN